MRTLGTLLIFIFLFSINFVNGQNRTRHGLTKRTLKTELKRDTTTRSLLYDYYFGGVDSLYSDYFYLYRVRTDPNYYRLFVPMTFYYSPMNQLSTSLWKFRSPYEQDPQEVADKLLPFDKSKYTKIKRTNKQVDRVLLDFYLDYPQLVVYTENEIENKKTFREDIGTKIPTKTSILALFKPDIVDVNARADMVIYKPNFWTNGGNGSLQFTQNYVSTNWYKGDESANSLVGNLQLFANYNDKEKIQFENLFEAKMGFNTVSGDTVRKYRINTDVLRLFSKLGFQAATNWYYTISGEINTQFFNNYKSNSNDLVSSFLAPANVAFSIGMDYKLKKNNINLSVIISPGAYSMKYVGNSKVDETQFGLEEGDKFLHDIGSQLQSTLAWTIIPSVTLNSRFSYFTNYEKVEAEWENTFDFVLNRYLSTKLFVHARFDDGAKKVEGKSYFQLKEMLSFGINYKW